jgi:hypothetical protein
MVKLIVFGTPCIYSCSGLQIAVLLFSIVCAVVVNLIDATAAQDCQTYCDSTCGSECASGNYNGTCQTLCRNVCNNLTAVDGGNGTAVCENRRLVDGTFCCVERQDTAEWTKWSSIGCCGSQQG